MKELLIKLGLSILNFFLNNEVVHDAIRAAAKKTTNEVDDAGAEALIAFLKDLGPLLGRKDA